MAPIPASNRRDVYNPVNSAGPFQVSFPVFTGDGSDITVHLDGEVQAGWTFTGTLESGFYGEPNTWVDGTVQLAGQVSGELVILGVRSPRRQNQYAEGRGVPARDLNASLNELTAVDQELRRDIDAVDSRIIAADDVFAARDLVRTRLLGAFDHFPTEAEIGIAFADGTQAFVYDQPDPLNDGMYVWQSGQWYPAGERPEAYGRSITIFADAAIVASGVVSVPGGYVPGLVDVLRNGVDMVIGSSPGTGVTDPDCTASNGTTVVFPVGVLQINDPIKIVRRRPIAEVGIAASDVIYDGSNVAAALASKAPIASPAFTGTPSAPNLTGGSQAGQIANKKYVDDSLASALSPAEVLISSATLAVAAAVIDIALTGSYGAYRIIIDNIEPVTGGGGLNLRLSFDGGSTYVASAGSYRAAGRYDDDAGGGGAANLVGSALLLTRSQPAAAGWNPMLELILSAAGPSAFPRMTWSWAGTVSGPSDISLRGAGRYAAAAGRPTHVRFLYGSDTIAAGARWRLYGMRG